MRSEFSDRVRHFRGRQGPHVHHWELCQLDMIAQRDANAQPPIFDRPGVRTSRPTDLTS